MTLLTATGVGVRYGGVRALSDVHLEVGAGEIVGLIGPNGAGKTTMIDALTGFTACEGELKLKGRSIAGLRPHQRARRGLCRTWQSAELFGDLSVRENLGVAVSPPGAGALTRELLTGRHAVAEQVDATLARLGIEYLADADTSSLTEGQRKLVGVARAIAAEPALICLDEPAAGLDSKESQGLGERLRAIADGGTALLLVEHDMGLVLGICDRVVVLDFGQVIASGTPRQIRADPAVITAYLGGEIEEDR